LPVKTRPEYGPLRTQKTVEHSTTTYSHDLLKHSQIERSKLSKKMETSFIKKVDTAELEQKVKRMYRDVAVNPKGEYHFEMGRGLAERLGYETSDLAGC